MVKLSDKIAYVGRDIEDAITLGFLDDDERKTLRDMAKANDVNAINTTVIIHSLISDVCAESSPERGIVLSARASESLRAIKQFNIRHIYTNERFNSFRKYCALALGELFGFFACYYGGADTFSRLASSYRPELAKPFAAYLARYCDAAIVPEELLRGFDGANKKIYSRLESESVYYGAVLDYLSGMTDRYAVNAFGMLLKF